MLCFRKTNYSSILLLFNVRVIIESLYRIGRLVRLSASDGLEYVKLCRRRIPSEGEYEHTELVSVSVPLEDRRLARGGGRRDFGI